MTESTNLRTSYFKHVGLTSTAPMAFEVNRAKGIYIYDQNDNKYIDLISGISVSSLGHSNPEIVKAVCEQAGKYMHTMVYGEHVQQPQVAFAELLVENLPDSLNNVYFVNSGTEAVEGAMKLVKKVTGRYEIIACKNSYHGSTHGSQSLMDSVCFSSPYRPFLPGIHFIQYALLPDLEKITVKTAAVFMETIQGEAGIRVASKEYMKALRQKCDETGTLLVFDEIQCGFGRTGKLFAFEHFDVVPDVMLIAKAMGGGMPIGAFVTRKELMETLATNPALGHINTFGGHPVSSAAAHASLKFLLSGALIEQVEKKAKLFIKLLQHKNILEIRQKGLMMAVDVGSKEKMEKMVAHAFENRILMDWFLFDEGSFRIAPPLIIEEEQIRHVCEVLQKGLDNL